MGRLNTCTVGGFPENVDDFCVCPLWGGPGDGTRTKLFSFPFIFTCLTLKVQMVFVMTGDAVDDTDNTDYDDATTYLLF